MENDNLNLTDVANQLSNLLVLCSKKKIDVLLTQDDNKLEIKFENGEPLAVTINIPDPSDENLPLLIQEWTEKIKAMP